MDLTQWSAVAAYALLCIAAGGGALRLLRLPRDPLVHNWAGCYFTGQLVLTVLVLSTGFLPIGLPAVLGVMALFGAGTLAVALLRHGLPSWAKRPWPAAGIALLWLALFPQLLLMVHATAPYEWDARSIWLFHGKGLLWHDGVSAAFFGDTQFWWSNLDYPLHIPAQAACSALLFGGWDDRVARAFLLVDFLAYGRLLLPILRARGHGALAAVVVGTLLFGQGTHGIILGEGYVTGQADYHYAVPLALAVLALASPLAGSGRAIAVLLAARAAAVKNEGMLYVFCTLLLWLAVAAWRWLRARPRPQWRDALPRLHGPVVGAVLALLLPTLLWGVWKRSHGVSGGLHLAERIMTPGVAWHAFAERSGVVLSYLASQMVDNWTHWLGVAWLLLSCAGAIVGRAAATGFGWRRHEPLVAGALLGACGIVCMTYVLTPHDVVMHMKTSALRVLVFPHLLVFVLCVFRLEALLAAHRGLQAAPPAASPTASPATALRG